MLLAAGRLRCTPQQPIHECWHRRLQRRGRCVATPCLHQLHVANPAACATRSIAGSCCPWPPSGVTHARSLPDGAPLDWSVPAADPVPARSPAHGPAWVLPLCRVVPGACCDVVADNLPTMSGGSSADNVMLEVAASGELVEAEAAGPRADAAGAADAVPDAAESDNESVGNDDRDDDRAVDVPAPKFRKLSCSEPPPSVRVSVGQWCCGVAVAAVGGGRWGTRASFWRSLHPAAACVPCACVLVAFPLLIAARCAPCFWPFPCLCLTLLLPPQAGPAVRSLCTPTAAQVPMPG